MSRGMFIPLVLLAEVSGLAGIALMVTWLAKYLGGFAWDGFNAQFNLHPLLMTIAMLFINGNALMFYRITVGIPVSRIATKLSHAALQLLALALGIVALFAVFGFHKSIGVANMYSFHSWVGMATFVMFGLQLVCGGVFFLLFAYGVARTEGLRANYLPLHVFFGKVILIMATITVCMGIQEKAAFSMGGDYQNLPTEAVFAHLSGLSFVLFSTLVLYIVSHDGYKPVQSHSAEYRDVNNHWFVTDFNYQGMSATAVIANLAGASFITFTVTVLYITSNNRYKRQETTDTNANVTNTSSTGYEVHIDDQINLEN